MRLYERYLSSVCTFFLLPEDQSDGLFERFSTKTSLLFTHRFSLSLSFKQENNNNNRKERRPHRPVYITVRTTTTDDEDNDGFGEEQITLG